MNPHEETYRIAIGLPLQEKLAPGDKRWTQLNSSFENQTLWAADVAALLHEGHTITTWHKDHWRKGENFLLGQHIGLDFDTGDERSTIRALAGNGFVQRHGGIVYTTPSHTPEAPRARVLFFLDTPIQQPGNYVAAAKALIWTFGGTADKQCSDPVRFFYGGRRGHCQMEYIGEQLPLKLVKAMIEEHRRHVESARIKPLPAPANERTSDLNDVSAALGMIPPWSIDYSEWLSVLMAIHSKWPGADGRELAERWADGKPGEVEAKWRSFHDTGNVTGRVSIATVFALAKRFGR